MANNRRHFNESIMARDEPYRHVEGDACDFTTFCSLKSLEQAYDSVKKQGASLGCSPEVFFALETEGRERLLLELGTDLLAGKYKPDPTDKSASPTRLDKAREGVLRDHIVQAALTIALMPLFQPEPGSKRDADAALHWLARAVERGLIRAYAEHLELNSGTVSDESLLNQVWKRGSDPKCLALLEQVLKASVEDSYRELLAPLLRAAALQGIDGMLEQIRGIGHQGVVSPVASARFGSDLIVLVDSDPQFDWVLPASQWRLSECLNQLNFDVDPAKTQLLQLVAGQTMLFMGFQLRAVRNARGGLTLCWHGARKIKSWRPRARSRPGQAIKVFWRGLWNPGRALPSLAKRFSLGFCWLLPGLYRKAKTFIVSDWHVLPALGRSLVQQLLNRWEILLLSCMLLAMGFLGWQAWADLPRESAIAKEPPGYLSGQYVPSGRPEPIRYWLYMPPQFEKLAGPHPLIFSVNHSVQGLAAAVREWLEREGHFDMAVFSVESRRDLSEADNCGDVMEALDYVVERHRIDLKRIYLVGHSQNGRSVWQMVVRFPQRWAAVAAIGLPAGLDFRWLGPAPCWVFHGETDKRSHADQIRALVKEMRDRGKAVKYTELPGAGHEIWPQVYGNPELFNWLAQQKRQ